MIPQFRRMETGFGIKDANFPLDSEGRTYHVGVKAGEVANRVLSVGDPSRAQKLADLFDNTVEKFHLETNRGFTTHTGLYKGVPISIIATGMGVAMMDFVVREVAGVTKGGMCIVRFGTCGSIDEDLKLGSVAVSNGSVMCRRNEEAWISEDKDAYTLSSSVVCADEDVSECLFKHISSAVDKVVMALNCTACSFYSSQGRGAASFDDRNKDLLQKIKHKYPSCKTLEMETFQLLHLAKCSKNQRIKASAAVIILADRQTNNFLSADEKHQLELKAGKAILDALIDVKIDDPMEFGVWNKDIQNDKENL